MTAIYNELDPFAAAWLRNLSSAGHIAPGVVDERSISDLAPVDVAGPGQRHFFAGIGGWSHALRLAGVPDDDDVWTGSCPCQPFSAAGRGLGTADVRHLWPVWFRLIAECRPAVIFGEQVASGPGLGWLDAVYADLEGAGYAVGAADLCAAGVGAPHIRQRIYFVAYRDGERCQPGRAGEAGIERAEQPSGFRNADELAVTTGYRRNQGVSVQLPKRQSERGVLEVDRSGTIDQLGDAVRQGGGRDTGAESGTQTQGNCGRLEHGNLGDGSVATGEIGHWSAADWLECRDGRARPVEPGAFPLAHGVSGRVGLLRGYGNAIVPQVAAAFIRAALEAA